MADPTKPVTPPPEPIPGEEYHWTYGLLFQSWLVLFLGVICFALVVYLLSYLPR